MFCLSLPSEAGSVLCRPECSCDSGTSICPRPHPTVPHFILQTVSSSFPLQCCFDCAGHLITIIILSPSPLLSLCLSNFPLALFIFSLCLHITPPHPLSWVLTPAPWVMRTLSGASQGGFPGTAPSSWSTRATPSGSSTLMAPQNQEPWVPRGSRPQTRPEEGRTRALLPNAASKTSLLLLPRRYRKETGMCLVSARLLTLMPQ